jgi:hypothetical protein
VGFPDHFQELILNRNIICLHSFQSTLIMVLSRALEEITLALHAPQMWSYQEKKKSGNKTNFMNHSSPSFKIHVRHFNSLNSSLRQKSEPHFKEWPPRFRCLKWNLHPTETSKKTHTHIYIYIFI